MIERSDAELSAMLAARAGRLPQVTEREILAAVQEEMRAPVGGSAFGVVPVVLRGGTKAPAGWAAIGLVAVVVLALVGGRLDTRPVAPAGSGGGSAAPAGTSTPGATPVPGGGFPLEHQVTMAGLRVGILDGTLDAKTVVLTGHLELQPWPCPSPLPQGCYGLKVAGLDGVDVSNMGLMSVDQAIATIRADTSDRPMVFRVTGTQLDFLGWIRRGNGTPLTVDALAALDAASMAPDLDVVSGWLSPGGSLPSCPPSHPSGSLCGSGPMLSQEAPSGGSGGSGPALPVTLDPGLGLDPGVGRGQLASNGPFVVRYMAYRGGDTSPYQVVASVNPGTAVFVVEPDTAPQSPDVLTPAQLRSGLSDGSLADQVVEIDGTLDGTAASLQVRGLEDIPVQLLLAPDGTVEPTPVVPIVGQLLFRARPGSLVYLGRASGPPDEPMTVARLLASGRAAGTDALGSVSGWLVVGGIHSCPFEGVGATPCPGPGPWLTDDKPFFDDGMVASNQGVTVMLDDVVARQVNGTIVTLGTFLVRWVLGSALCDAPANVDCSGSRPEVVAIIDPAHLLQVALP